MREQRLNFLRCDRGGFACWGRVGVFGGVVRDTTRGALLLKHELIVTMVRPVAWGGFFLEILQGWLGAVGRIRAGRGCAMMRLLLCGFGRNFYAAARLARNQA